MTKSFDLIFLSIVSLLVFITGCSPVSLIQALHPENPDIKYIDYTLKSISAKQVNFVLNFSVKNPNQIGLKDITINYELFTEGRKILSGRETDLALIPSGESMIQVPAEITYADALKIIGPLAERLWSQSKTLPVDAHVSINGKPTLYDGFSTGELFSFNYSTTRHIEVPLPQDKIDSALEKMRNKIKNLGQ